MYSNGETFFERERKFVVSVVHTKGYLRQLYPQIQSLGKNKTLKRFEKIFR